MPQSVNCIDYFNGLFFKNMPDDLKSNIWIAGGGIKDWFTDGHVINDCDFFCVDRKSMAKLILFLRSKYSFKHFILTKNAVKGVLTINGSKMNVDIVKKPFQNPLECISKFDFTVCCFSVNSDAFFYHISAPFDLIRMRLVINELPHPVDTLKRLNKYVKKGYTACNGTLLTLAKSIAQQDINDESIFSFYKFD